MTEENKTTEAQEASVTEDNKVLDDLLGNPFGEIDTQSLSTVQQQEMNALQEQTAAPKVYDKLSDKEKEQAEALATQIDVSNSQAVLQYGNAAEAKLSQFSNVMLAKVQNQDLSEIGDSLTSLMFNLQQSDPNELSQGEGNFFKKMFGKVKKSIFEITAKYQSISAQIDKVAIKLEKDKNKLIEDNRNLDNLYKQNLDFFNAMNVYIAAAELKQEELRDKIIPASIEKAKQTGDQMDAQIVQDQQQFLDRLEKRTYDLKLSRQITIQQAPQIRLIQNTNQTLAERIQTSINTSIPLWKNQVVIALTLLKQKDAATAQRQVTETTNDLLTKNSEMLKISTIETSRENERGIVDIETLQKTQNDLIETIEETMRIQKEGKEKRHAAEIELAHMEENLKTKLLQMANREKEEY